jgi:hypothetical protein
VSPQLRWALILAVGIAAAVSAGWLCLHFWPNWGGWLSAAFSGLLIAAVAIPLLDDARREMHQ